jgi:hypothetical protein
LKNGAPTFHEKHSYAIPHGIMGYSSIHVTDNEIDTLFWAAPCIILDRVMECKIFYDTMADRSEGEALCRRFEISDYMLT